MEKIYNWFSNLSPYQIVEGIIAGIIVVIIVAVIAHISIVPKVANIFGKNESKEEIIKEKSKKITDSVLENVEQEKKEILNVKENTKQKYEGALGSAIKMAEGGDLWARDVVLDVAKKENEKAIISVIKMAEGGDPWARDVVLDVAKKGNEKAIISVIKMAEGGDLWARDVLLEIAKKNK